MSVQVDARGRAAAGPPAVIDAARLVWHQFRYDLLIFARNRQSTFFTIMLPVIFLVIFAGVFRNDTTTLTNGEKIKQSTYYVPQIIALGIVSAAFSNVVGVIIYQRETGVLKRRRATPVPAWVLVAGRALTAVALSFVLVAVLLLVGRLAYGVTLRASTIPGMILTTLAGALSLCCVAYALTTLVESNESSQPVIQAITLPIFFISGTFFPESIVPAWLLHVADVFPVRHLGHALLTAFGPGGGSGIDATDLLVLAIWAIAGIVVATRRFSWLPRGGRAE